MSTVDRWFAMNTYGCRGSRGAVDHHRQPNARRPQQHPRPPGAPECHDRVAERSNGALRSASIAPMSSARPGTPGAEPNAPRTPDANHGLGPKWTGAIIESAVDFRKTYYILPNLFTLSNVLRDSSRSRCRRRDRGNGSIPGGAGDLLRFLLRHLRRPRRPADQDPDRPGPGSRFAVGPDHVRRRPGAAGLQVGPDQLRAPGHLHRRPVRVRGAMRLARFNVLSRREKLAPGRRTRASTRSG
jgi:hypothetical protein